MNKYNNGKLYLVSSKKTTLVYIGSTTDEIRTRLKQHKNAYNQYNNHKHHYYTVFEIVQYDDADIKLLEEFFSTSKLELRKQEQYWIDQYPHAINKHRAYSENELKYGSLQDSKIYKIVSDKTTSCYIGSTIFVEKKIYKFCHNYIDIVIVNIIF